MNCNDVADTKNVTIQSSNHYGANRILVANSENQRRKQQQQTAITTTTTTTTIPPHQQQQQMLETCGFLAATTAIQNRRRRQRQPTMLTTTPLLLVVFVGMMMISSFSFDYFNYSSRTTIVMAYSVAASKHKNTNHHNRQQQQHAADALKSATTTTTVQVFPTLPLSTSTVRTTATPDSSEVSPPSVAAALSAVGEINDHSHDDDEMSRSRRNSTAAIRRNNATSATFRQKCWSWICRQRIGGKSIFLTSSSSAQRAQPTPAVLFYHSHYGNNTNSTTTTQLSASSSRQSTSTSSLFSAVTSAIASVDLLGTKALVIEDDDSDEELTSTKQLSSPVHVQHASDQRAEEEEETSQESNDDDKSKPQQQTSAVIHIHSVTDRKTGVVWRALGSVSITKFQSFLKYSNVKYRNNKKAITTQTVTIIRPQEDDEENCTENVQRKTDDDGNIVVVDGDDDAEAKLNELRDLWRASWKSRNLITDRTELLARYPTTSNIDDEDEDTAATASKQQEKREKKSKLNNKHSRGDFNDLLALYRERIGTVYETEGADNVVLFEFLQRNYPRFQDLAKLTTTTIMKPDDQLRILKDFLLWFKEEFPYYYDRCESCGASYKEYRNEQQRLKEKKKKQDAEDSNSSMDPHRTFIGYTYPSEEECTGQASRTELYQCHKCASYTRFPRYNSVAHVLRTHQGRCGEYAMLLFRFLRCLSSNSDASSSMAPSGTYGLLPTTSVPIQCRWVVDWADHVWCEVQLNGKWIHLDPCEAAVDENYIYESWGKKQTYIIAFYLPPVQQQNTTAQNDQQFSPLMSSVFYNKSTSPAPSTHPVLIEDVTNTYTNDSLETIRDRRQHEDDSSTRKSIQVALARANEQLKLSIESHDERHSTDRQYHTTRTETTVARAPSADAEILELATAAATASPHVVLPSDSNSISLTTSTPTIVYPPTTTTKAPVN